MLSPEPTLRSPYAVGRSTGVNAEVLQVLQKKGIVLSLPIEGIRLLRGGQTGLAYGT